MGRVRKEAGPVRLPPQPPRRGGGGGGGVGSRQGASRVLELHVESNNEGFFDKSPWPSG